MEILRPNDEETSICHCCGYAASDLKEYRNNNFETAVHKPTYRFCEICASTYLSQCVEYPEFAKDARLCKSLGWIANLLRDEIRALKIGVR